MATNPKVNHAVAGPAGPMAGAAKRRLGNHPGFRAVQSQIAAKDGISNDQAGAILAASSRRASAKAKSANPRLNRVKG